MTRIVLGVLVFTVAVAALAAPVRAQDEEPIDLVIVPRVVVAVRGHEADPDSNLVLLVRAVRWTLGKLR